MSSTSKNDKDTSSYMNNRIPRKKTASSLINGGNKSTGIQIDSAFTNEKQSAVASDILSVPIPRKGKDGMQPNNKKRTHDMSSIATTKTKAPKKAKLNNNETTSTTRNDTDISTPEQIPIYEIVKEGRVSGYPIIVSQVGSEHDAILLGCKATDNPQEYLDNNKDGKVKIRWKFAGYNGLVPTNTVRLKVADLAPPIRKAAVLSGLLETGDELAVNKDVDIDLGDDEDDDAPILKAVRTELLDNTSRADKDGDYNDQKDKDEKLVCYERSASVGYAGGKMGTAAPPTDNGTGISLKTNQVGVSSEEISASANQESNAEGAHTEFNPQVDEAPTASTASSESEEVNTAVVLEFFKKLNTSLEEQMGSLGDIEEMIKANPYLLRAKCPNDIGDIQEGYIAMEAVCQQEIRADTRDLLYEIVLLGGKATDKCYEVLDGDDVMPFDHITVLLLSGYYPTKGHYLFLDELAEGLENNDHDVEPDEFLSILCKTVKLGDWLSCGDVDSTVIINNINQLPPLEAGVTHSKGGPMEELLKREKVQEQDSKSPLDEANISAHEPTPTIVTSQSGIKLEDGDGDSVTTDPMVINEEVVPVVVTSDINVKTKGEETDDECKPSAVASNMNVKLEGEETDDERELQPVVSGNDVKMEGEAAYECDTDDDEVKPLEVTSDMNVKTEEVETDEERELQPVASSNDVKNETEAAYECDTDDDVVKPLVVKSDMNVKAEEEDTDNEMNTSFHNHDNPTISAPTSEEDETVVLGFFEKLNSCLQVYNLDGIKEMIKSHPSLLNATCPSDISKIKKGCTAMEALCCWEEEDSHSTRDLLYDLVMLGGKATDKCYVNVWKRNCRDSLLLEHLSVLFRSGHYPTNHFFLDNLSDLYQSGFKVSGSSYFFLDELAKELEGDGEEPTDFLSMVYKIVKLGDSLGIDGVIQSQLIIDNINSLPSLETGVTHSKGGPMEKLLNRLPAEKVQVEKEESLDDSDSSSDDEEIKLTIAGVDIEKVKKKVKSIVKSSNTELTVKGIRKQLEEWLNCDLSNDRDAVRKIVMEADLITEQEKQLERREQDEREQKKKKKKKKKKDEKSPSTTTRTCSVCEMIKDRDDFSKTQWKKGDDAKCKDCIAIKQGPEAQKKLAAERSLLDKQINKKDGSILDEQVTVSEKGGVTAEGFSLDKQASNVATEKGANISAPDPSPQSHYEKVEIMEYKQKKARYDEHAKKLEESGRSIEEEMKSSTDLVYVVTSVQRGGDPFSPQLHGIYTTCKRAQESARKVFGNVSRSYRKGKFIPDKDRIAKCDTSEYLIPGIEYTSRIMFELFGDEENDDYNAVAVTAIKIDVDLNVDLPFLDNTYEDILDMDERKDIKHPLTLGTVFAIFSYNVGRGFEHDVTLAGVYTKREDAIERALKVAWFDKWSKGVEEIKKRQIDHASGVSNGMLFHDEEDGCWAIAMETVTLNVDVSHNRELELGVYSDGIWMCPRVEI